MRIYDGEVEVDVSILVEQVTRDTFIKITGEMPDTIPNRKFVQRESDSMLKISRSKLDPRFGKLGDIELDD